MSTKIQLPKNMQISEKTSKLKFKNDDKKIAEYVDYKLIIAFISLLLIGLLFYTNSKGYSVKKTNKKLKIIEKYQNISNYDEDGEKPLKDLLISSSFNSLSRYRCMIDYQDPSILKNILRLGVRYIELNVFAESFQYGSKPIISSGYKKGQWKLMFNKVEFENCIKVIKENAFTELTNINGSPNSEDPFFLGLNLHTGYNTETLNIVSEIIIKELAEYLLPPQYSYQYEEHFENVTYNVLRNKLVIFSSPGFEGSKLEELINASWIDDTVLNSKESFINYFSTKAPKANLFPQGEEGFTTDLYDELVEKVLRTRKILRISAKNINSFGFNSDYVKDHNKTGLTIVVPNVEGDIIPTNYDPAASWDLGCQFVAMNYQNIDENIDKYVTHFKKAGITLQ